MAKKGTITIELVQPFPAWAKKLAQFQNQFANNYDGTVKASQYNRKEREMLVLQDIYNEYAFWIILNNKEKIGYILAPTMSDPITKEKKGRYLDIRYIVPEHRGKGYGAQALDRLCEYAFLDNVKVNGKHMKKNWYFWYKRGFTKAVMAMGVDKNFKEERNFQDDPEYDHMYNHWYMLHKNSHQLEILEKAKMPMLDFEDWVAHSRSESAGKRLAQNLEVSI